MEEPKFKRYENVVANDKPITLIITGEGRARCWISDGNKKFDTFRELLTSLKSGDYSQSLRKSHYILRDILNQKEESYHLYIVDNWAFLCNSVFFFSLQEVNEGEDIDISKFIKLPDNHYVISFCMTEKHGDNSRFYIYCSERYRNGFGESQNRFFMLDIKSNILKEYKIVEETRWRDGGTTHVTLEDSEGNPCNFHFCSRWNKSIHDYFNDVTLVEANGAIPFLKPILEGHLKNVEIFKQF